MKTAPIAQNTITNTKEKKANDPRHTLSFFMAEQQPHRAINQESNANRAAREITKKFRGIGKPYSPSVSSRYMFILSNKAAFDAIRPAITVNTAASDRKMLKTHKVFPKHFTHFYLHRQTLRKVSQVHILFLSYLK